MSVFYNKLCHLSRILLCISLYSRSQCSPSFLFGFFFFFLLDSVSVDLFLTANKTFEFTLTISLVIVASNAGNWSVKTRDVSILNPNTSSFGLCPKWYWSTSLALTAQIRTYISHLLTSFSLLWPQLNCGVSQYHCWIDFLQL